MSPHRIRVLVVDDSAFARKVIRELLLGSGRIDVVGIARDGLEALEKVVELKPDVVTLDLMMPALDGIGFLKSLPSVDRPRVIVVSSLELSSDKAVEALTCGALEVIRKPTALATTQLYDLSTELVRAVLEHGNRSATPSPVAHESAPRPQRQRPCDLVLIGASTGGPQALVRLLSMLPANFPAPIGIALHIPIGYTTALAQRLDDSCQIEVHEADEGMVFRPGLAILARGGEHLKLASKNGQLIARLDHKPALRPHRPSVDELFLSGVALRGAGVLGVVMTGMGNDGLEGARAIAAAAGVILAESQQSCVVFGMSRAVLEADIGAIAMPLERMAEGISSHV